MPLTKSSFEHRCFYCGDTQGLIYNNDVEDWVCADVRACINTTEQ